ncbi:MAG TPA: non-canonical purine NTP pyrophosphatase [Clostridiales bacterium]|nr:non-canonical purine NTP pyrophosphatase [Clostridiales bacterium]
MKKLIIASNNQGKIKEFKAMLSGVYDEIISLKDADICVDIAEDGETFHQNARKKAIEISKLTSGDVLADDSGLCVDALQGAPGVYSARFSGECATDEQNNQKLLDLMREQSNKKARFVCALVLANNGKEKLFVEDFVEGTILDAPRGENGFGYDPLFYSDEYRQSFAELPQGDKNKISHRARALSRLVDELSR